MRPHKNIRNFFKIRLSEQLRRKIMADQCDRCAICRKLPTKRKLAVDHSHITGQIRGLLCLKCNVALGLLEENLASFIRAVEYLQSGRNYGDADYICDSNL